MILSAKKYVAALLVFVCVCMIFSPLTAYAAEDSSQHETVKVGFFAMDGYHVMDEEGNRSGYGYDFLRLMARYWDVDYEYVEECETKSSVYAKYRFLVSDNGMGMSADFKDTIFDAFTRAESSITNKIQGTGLGMAMIFFGLWPVIGM